MAEKSIDMGRSRKELKLYARGKSKSFMSMSTNNGTQLVSGNWSIDNTNPNSLLVILNFGTTVPFDVLNENWKITESEVDRLALEIGSEINEDLKILVFEKQ